MSDEPYVEMTGGSYRIDPKAKTITRVGGTEEPATHQHAPTGVATQAPTSVQPETPEDAAPAGKKGK